MAGEQRGPGTDSIIRFQSGPPSARRDDTRIVVVDTTWTGVADRVPGVIGLREVAGGVLSNLDLVSATSNHLDDWVGASGVIPALAVQGGSMWYQNRVHHWTWLQHQILWLSMVDALVLDTPTTAIECAEGLDPDLVEAARLIAARDGLAFRVEAADPPPDETLATQGGGDAVAPAPAAERGRLVARVRRLARRLVGPRPPTERERRLASVEERLERLSREPGRLLVLAAHARQRVETVAGPRHMNVYLGPIVDHLRGGPLDPVEIEHRGRIEQDAVWEGLSVPGAERHLPADVIRTTVVAPEIIETARVDAERAASRVVADAAPMLVAGVDLGPVVARRVATETSRSFAGHVRRIEQVRSLLRRLRPAFVLLADEYHRQEWLTAARLERVPTIAVQHGLIYRWHNGYIHRDRPPELDLPDRTYVFGEWERRLLTTASVYRDDEVRVGGSPRLDLVSPTTVDRPAVRAELGVAEGDRLVVISGTWGPIYRRFYYPIVLARLFDRPMPKVHVVVKLHPGEPDEGPYRGVIEGVAAACGFEPPPISVVQSVDLYRLLKAADAHVGVHSTVLTEAVAAGTPNLLADILAGADLLGYVAAGVATPVRDGGELLAALDAVQDEAGMEAARKAFLAEHFRPGPAGERIAAELLAWPT